MESKGVVAASTPLWIPVTESLPEAHSMVLVAVSTGRVDIDETFDRKDGGRSWCGYRDDLITHWMPLPQPPKEVPHA